MPHGVDEENDDLGVAALDDYSPVRYVSVGYRLIEWGCAYSMSRFFIFVFVMRLCIIRTYLLLTYDLSPCLVPKGS